MNALNIKLYTLIKNNLHIPDDKAGEFVQVLDDIIHTNIKDSAMEFKSVVKEDLSQLDGEIRKLDTEIKKLDAKIDLKVSDLRCEIKESKVDTIKWMIGIFLALALMIMGLYIKK
jgi:hypothetical protein